MHCMMTQAAVRACLQPRSGRCAAHLSSSGTSTPITAAELYEPHVNPQHSSAMKTIVACLAAAAVAAASAEWAPPLYRQCDPRWGANEMGTVGNGERSTICGEGCAMSSVSSALAGLGVQIDGECYVQCSRRNALQQRCHRPRRGASPPKVVYLCDLL